MYKNTMSQQYNVVIIQSITSNCNRTSEAIYKARKLLVLGNLEKKDIPKVDTFTSKPYYCFFFEAVSTHQKVNKPFW